MDHAHDLPTASDAHDEPDGPHRRGLLKCMAWAGTGVLWTMSGGVPRSHYFILTLYFLVMPN